MRPPALPVLVAALLIVSCGGGGGGGGPSGPMPPPTAPVTGPPPVGTNPPLPPSGPSGDQSTHWIYPSPTVRIAGDATPAQRRALSGAVADLNQYVPAGHRLTVTEARDATIAVSFDLGFGVGVAYNAYWAGAQAFIRGGGRIQMRGEGRTERQLHSALIHELGHAVLNSPDDYDRLPGPFGYCCPPMDAESGAFVARYYDWGRWAATEPAGGVTAMAYYLPGDVHLGLIAPPRYEGPLTGSATWTGSLVGYEPPGRLVRGDAAIRLSGETMAGTAAFTGLHEPDSAYARPDLAYALELFSDGTFRSPGDYEVRGAVVGDGSGALGTLRRADLDAAFGAERR